MQFAYGSFKPNKLWLEFKILENQTAATDRGRVLTSKSTEETRMIRAVLSQASPQEIEMYSQPQHPISHAIVHRGAPKAKEGDSLILGKDESRTFRIQRVKDPGEMSLWTIYYAEERKDVPRNT